MQNWVTRYKIRAKFLSLLLLCALLALWQAATLTAAFDPSGLNENDIMLMEMNGDIIPDPDNEGEYINNPEKSARSEPTGR